MSSRKLSIYYWLVKRFPAKILYFSFMWVMVHSTTGKHANTVVTELTAMEAVKRYADDNNIH